MKNRQSNVERTGFRSIAMSKLLRKSKDPARHLDLDWIRFNKDYTKPIYVAECSEESFHPTKITKKIGQWLNCKSYFFHIKRDIRTDEVIWITVRDLVTGEEKYRMTPEMFTLWDEQFNNINNASDTGEHK